jgi:hypothetical protein
MICISNDTDIIAIADNAVQSFLSTPVTITVTNTDIIAIGEVPLGPVFPERVAEVRDTPQFF